MTTERLEVAVESVTCESVTCQSCLGAGASAVPEQDAWWSGAARQARWLALLSLAWMTVEGTVGLVAGISAGSIALVAWALGSAVEGLASLAVIWRFSGARIRSQTAEQLATRVIGICFWIVGPLVAAEAVRDLLGAHHPETSYVGMALTAAAVLAMPVLGRVKHRLGDRLGSVATGGEGSQNYLCAAQAGAVLIGLAITALWTRGWWVDPIIALGIAVWAVRQGVEAWRGEECTC